MRVACVLVTHLRAKVELRTRPHLKDRQVLVVDRSRGRPLVIDHSPAATGVTAGMTLEQALSRCADGVILEADEPSYRRVFRQTLLSLQGISERVEGAELGTAYVRLDGLEELYGGEARLVNALLNATPQDLMPRVGLGDAKFPAFIAALTSRALGAAKAPRDVAGFLAPHSVDLLPFSPGVRDEMHRFGFHTMGDVASVREEMLIDRFGPAGKRAWDLSHGIDPSPLITLKHEESIVEHTSLPFSSTSMEFLLAAVNILLRRAYSRPRMRGRYAGRAALECILYREAPWEKAFHFKQGVGAWERASRIVRSQLEADYPRAPVEELTLGLSNLTGESGVQLSLLTEVREGRERRLAETDRQLQARMNGKPALYRVVEVAPWHPAPELRALQVPIDATGRDGMKPLLQPGPVVVREGPERQPVALQLDNRWHRVAHIEDRWCFDLWWMREPLTRTYYRVSREDGGQVTLFRDQREDCWYRQDS